MIFDTVDRANTHCSKWDGLKEKFGKSDILPLWVADMDIAAPQAAQDAMMARIAHPVYGYDLYSEGFYQSIIDWYADRFDWKIEREWIVPEHGVVVSINLAIDAFSRAGDGILIQTPIYPPFISAIERNGRTLLESRLRLEGAQVYIDFEDFEQKARDAKIFLLCSPHNPTTRIWTSKELEQMIEICHRHNVLIVSDEIHSDFVFRDRHIPTPALKKAAEITLLLHAPSKTFNIAGLNTSYLIVPSAALREQYVKAHQRAGLDNGNVFGIVALESVYREGGEWLDALKIHLQENSVYVRMYLAENIPEIVLSRHDATFLLWLDCRGLGLDDDALMKFFVEEAKLGLNSGSSFGAAGSGFMRLNIGTGREMLERAMVQLKTAIDKVRE